MDSLLVFLVFIAISAASAWLQKRRQAEEDQAESWPGQDQPRPGTRVPPQTSRPPLTREGQPPSRPRNPMHDWQEELRRLLEGDRPRPTSTQTPSTSHHPQPPRPQPAPPPLAPVASRESEEGPQSMLGRVEESTQAYRRAQAQKTEAAARLLELQRKTGERERRAGIPILRTSPRNDIQAARTLFSHPQSARQAVIASIVIGPPKAFE